MKIENKPDGSAVITLSKSEVVKLVDDLLETSRHFDLDQFFEDSGNSIESMYELLSMKCITGEMELGFRQYYPEDEIPERE